MSKNIILSDNIKGLKNTAELQKFIDKTFFPEDIIDIRANCFTIISGLVHQIMMLGPGVFMFKKNIEKLPQNTETLMKWVSKQVQKSDSEIAKSLYSMHSKVKSKMDEDSVSAGMTHLSPDKKWIIMFYPLWIIANESGYLQDKYNCHIDEELLAESVKNFKKSRGSDEGKALWGSIFHSQPESVMKHLMANTIEIVGELSKVFNPEIAYMCTIGLNEEVEKGQTDRMVKKESDSSMYIEVGSDGKGLDKINFEAAVIEFIKDITVYHNLRLDKKELVKQIFEGKDDGDIDFEYSNVSTKHLRSLLEVFGTTMPLQ